MSVKTGESFKKYKRVWASANKLLVVSWDVNSGTNDFRTYEIKAFVESGNTYVAVGNVISQSYLDNGDDDN